MAKRLNKFPAQVAPTVHDRIRAAEKALLAGQTARVLVSESDLEKIADLIASSGQTYAQILKKAVHLGVAVLGTPTTAAPEPQGGCMADFDEPDKEPLDWVRPEPIPYGGFELRRPAGRHEPAVEEPTAEPTPVSEEQT
jgi:hypothetical protein